MAWRANGYHPHSRSLPLRGRVCPGPNIQRSLTRLPMAIRIKGHSFYVIYFPTCQCTTWVYDVATSMWHNRGMWNGISYSAHPSQNHMYFFGQHLVGDWNSGNIYTQNIDIRTYNGEPIRFVRTAPHISKEQQWQFHEQLQVYMESGLSPSPLHCSTVVVTPARRKSVSGGAMMAARRGAIITMPA